jgi:rRNA biogenesis protein RRP5
MRVMGQIVGILPLTLLVSLPNQLLGHIPITNISPQFTQRLEQMDQDEDMEPSDSEDEDAEGSPKLGLPELGQMFAVGQYVRAAVTAVFQGGASDPSGLYKSRDELAKLCKRVELSLSPNLVNEGVKVDDLKSGFVSSPYTLHLSSSETLVRLLLPQCEVWKTMATS